MSATLAQQISEVANAPLPIAVLCIAVAGVIWRIFKWRYDTIIEGLKHRLDLRDDTIKRYESGGALDASKIADVGLTPVASKESGLKTSRVSGESLPTQHGLLNEDCDRKFVSPSLSLSDLRSIYEGKTDIQAEKQAQLYLGKWMHVSGKVQTVYAVNDNQTRLRLLDDEADAIGLRGLWLKFDDDRDVLETLKVSDKVFALGKLETFSRFDVDLVECELLKAE